MVEAPALQQRSSAFVRFLMIPLLMGFIGGLVFIGSRVDVAAVVLLVVTTVAALVIFGRAATNEPNPTLVFQVLVLAWLVKLGGVVFKTYIAFSLYGGSVDATRYHEAGMQVASVLAAGGVPELGENIRQILGTRVVEIVVGIMYFITTPTVLGGWFVFALLGTLGMLFQYKAFVTALPQGDRHWFMALVFFSPSIVIWTNSLGKDALIAFFLGMATYGVALIYRRGLDIGSILLTVLGTGGVGAVRPHIAAIMAVALAGAVVFRPVRAGALTPIIRFATVAAVAVLAVLVIRTSASFVGVEDLSVEGVSEFAQTQQQQSSTGGSAFVGSFPTTPQGLGLAIVTVLFRPFPWEAGGTLALASAAEGIALMGLILWRFRHVARAIGSVFSTAFLMYVCIYIAIFIFFFSAISNFGILVRQRVQLLPFIFVLIAFSRAPATEETEFEVASFAPVKPGA